MRICLSHRSALDCWQSLRKGGDSYIDFLLTECERRKTREHPSISKTEIEKLSDKLGFRLPVCVETPSGYRRHSTPYCRFSQRRKFLENDSVFEIDDKVSLPSPEAVFLQMSELLDATDLAKLGMELSASYVLATPTSEIIRVAPLLNIEKAIALAQQGTTVATRKALRVLPYVYQGCESPAEVEMALKLLLPTRWGGLGLQGASINPVIPLSEASHSITAKKTCRPDMLFAEIKVDVEYDGAEWHSTADQLINDMKRWHALRREGFEVINVNAKTLRNPELMTQLAREIKRAQGKDLRIRTENFEEKQRELFRKLANHKQAAC